MWFTAIATFVCFVFANIASTVMVQAEARNRAVLAGTFEGVYALFWIVAARYALVTLGEKNVWLIVLELVVLFAGNFVGAWLGTKAGERYVVDLNAAVVETKLAEHEAALSLYEDSIDELTLEVEFHLDSDAETA